MQASSFAGCGSLIPIRCQGAVHFYRGRDLVSDEPRVIVTAPRMAATDARTLLAKLARLHPLVAGPHVPTVAAADLDGPRPWVALACDAVADLEIAAEAVRQGGVKTTFAEGVALGSTIMRTLIGAHRVRDPHTDAPICLGSVSMANVLIAADGKIWLVGFGLGPLPNACIAPEVASGGELTPGADVFAVTLFVRSQIAATELLPQIGRVFAGRPLPEDAPLTQLLLWSNSRILAGPPAARPTMEEALASAQQMWALLGIEPNVAGFSAWLARATASELEPDVAALTATTADSPSIVVGRDGAWMETNGTRHGLASRRPLRRVLFALADARCVRAGRALGVEELLSAGWPGEDPLPEAGSNRVYVAISTLRKLGLGERLQRWDGGYRIDPEASCRIEAES